MPWAVPISNVRVAFWYLCNSVLTLSQPVPVPSKPFHYLSLNVPTIVIKVPLPLSSHCLSFFCFCFCFLSSAIIFKKKPFKIGRNAWEREVEGMCGTGVLPSPCIFSPSSSGIAFRSWAFRAWSAAGTVVSHDSPVTGGGARYLQSSDGLLTIGLLVWRWDFRCHFSPCVLLLLYHPCFSVTMGWSVSEKKGSEHGGMLLWNEICSCEF